MPQGSVDLDVIKSSSQLETHDLEPHSPEIDVFNPSLDARMEIVNAYRDCTSKPFDLGCILISGSRIVKTSVLQESLYAEARYMEFIRTHSAIPVP